MRVTSHKSSFTKEKQMTPEERKTLMKRCGGFFRKVYVDKSEAMDACKFILDAMKEEGIKGAIACIKSVPRGYFVLMSDSEFLRGRRGS